MDPRSLRALLAAVAAGEVTPDQAAERLAELPYADLGFAKLDLHRELRGGLPEVVYGEGKTLDELRAIARRLHAAHGRALITRVAPEVAPVLVEELAEELGGATYHERARLLTLGVPRETKARDDGSESAAGPLAVVSAGTADLAVAEEAAIAAEWFGLRVERHRDVGIAGLHRLLSVLPELRRARAVIAVAGMDGALPTAVAGLVAAPVIAVPTSAGYGASFSGVTPLLTMLTACAPGVAVVNIDSGFGAAVLAWRILTGGVTLAAG